MAVDWTPIFENLKEELKKTKERDRQCDMEKLIENCLGCNQIKSCGDRTCEEICKEVLRCGVCPISKAIDKLAEYEKAEEEGLIVRVTKGQWIFKNDGAYGKRRTYCSVCGKRSGIGGIESNQRKPYCPNCGANMKGE